jgi:hypothetical protein
MHYAWDNCVSELLVDENVTSPVTNWRQGKDGLLLLGSLNIKNLTNPWLLKYWPIWWLIFSNKMRYESALATNYSVLTYIIFISVTAECTSSNTRTHFNVTMTMKNGQQITDYVRFEIFTAVTMKNAVFSDIKTQVVPYRKHITSPLQRSAG